MTDHVYNGKKVFAKLGSDEPPFRILVAGGGTGDATVMFSVAFAMARLRLEIVQVDLSQASINVAKA
jgi:ubiquinone/menaquinone biosynthesis C-methylase UbiE|eukprot:COSAG01_NODE_7727_length_3082_cov_2.513577_5_plen_67_part_00